MLVEGNENNSDNEEQEQGDTPPQEIKEENNNQDQGEANPIEDKDEQGQEDLEPSITFGDEDSQQDDGQSSHTIQDMRKALREAQKDLREYKRKEKEESDKKRKDKLRDKPTLADHDFDEESYYEDVARYEREKISHENRLQEVDQKNRQIQEDYNQKVQGFNEGYKSLSFKDKDEALEEVMSKFDNKQQGVILDAVDNPAMIVYALGKNSKKLEVLAKEKNLIKLGSQLAKLETQLRVIERKPKTNPESTVKGTGGTTDRARDKLLSEARRTRNYSALHAYDRRNKP